MLGPVKPHPTSRSAAPDQDAPAPATGVAGRVLRGLARATVLLSITAIVILLLGFFWFAASLPGEEVKLDRNADGIVVLTGGASRIDDALELLARKRGQRLLISGAHRSTNANDIVRLHPDFEGIVRCCVDFDQSLNTLGNAVETRRWAQARKIRSLIVVTSGYHMPRAMAEIGHQLAGVDLIAFPVLSEALRTGPWWSNEIAARLIVSEYFKLVFTQIRIRINPAVAD